MKNYLFQFVAIIAIAFSACKKDENKNNAIYTTWKWEKAVEKNDASSVYIPGEQIFLQFNDDQTFYSASFDSDVTNYNGGNIRDDISGQFTVANKLITLDKTVLDNGLKAGNYKFEGKDKLRIDITVGETNSYLIFKKVDLDLKPIIYGPR